MLTAPVAKVLRRSCKRHAAIVAFSPRSFCASSNMAWSTRRFTLLQPETGVRAFVVKTIGQPSTRLTPTKRCRAKGGKCTVCSRPFLMRSPGNCSVDSHRLAHPSAWRRFRSTGSRSATRVKVGPSPTVLRWLYGALRMSPLKRSKNRQKNPGGGRLSGLVHGIRRLIKQTFPIARSNRQASGGHAYA
jgi:hypothetical protein